MRFKAALWKTGASTVLTVPPRLEVAIGKEYWVALEEVQDAEGTD